MTDVLILVEASSAPIIEVPVSPTLVVAGSQGPGGAVTVDGSNISEVFFAGAAGLGDSSPNFKYDKATGAFKLVGANPHAFIGNSAYYAPDAAFSYGLYQQSAHTSVETEFSAIASYTDLTPVSAPVGGSVAKGLSTYISYLNSAFNHPSHIEGGFFFVEMSSPGRTLADSYGIDAEVGAGAGTITAAKAGYFAVLSYGTGTVETGYGVYIDSIAGTTAKWGVYQADPLASNHFKGATFFGNTVPYASDATYNWGVIIETTFTSPTQYVDGFASYINLTPTANRTIGSEAVVGYINMFGAFNHTSNNYGVAGAVENRGSGTVANAIGVNGTVNGVTGTIGSAKGVEAGVIKTAGTINTGYGVYVGAVQATTAWGFYQEPTAGAKNYFGNDVIQKLSATVTPANNGELMVQATSNTSLRFRYKGSDGVVRGASLTLA